MHHILLVCLVLLLASCAPLTDPLVLLAKPAPDLPMAVQVARVLVLGVGFVVLCWLLVRVFGGGKGE